MKSNGASLVPCQQTKFAQCNRANHAAFPFAGPGSGGCTPQTWQIAFAAWSLGVMEMRSMNEAGYTGVYVDLTGKIIKAALEVHSELGCGLKEEAYEAALAWKLSQRGHRVQRQVPCPVIYKGNVFCQDDEHPKRIDLLVDDKIVVELKAVCTRHPVFAAQCRTYLRMLNLPVGLVLNFGFPSLKEGIEHVSNPKATTNILKNSKTPGSESNETEGRR